MRKRNWTTIICSVALLGAVSMSLQWLRAETPEGKPEEKPESNRSTFERIGRAQRQSQLRELREQLGVIGSRIDERKLTVKELSRTIRATREELRLLEIEQEKLESRIRSIHDRKLDEKPGRDRPRGRRNRIERKRIPQNRPNEILERLERMEDRFERIERAIDRMSRRFSDRPDRPFPPRRRDRPKRPPAKKSDVPSDRKEP